MSISNIINYEQKNYSVDEVKAVSRDNSQERRSRLQEDIKENIDIKQIEDIIEKLNKQILIYDRRLDISIHEKTKQVMVKVIDAGTDEVIREIPPEKVLDMNAKLLELSGIIVDKKI